MPRPLALSYHNITANIASNDNAQPIKCLIQSLTINFAMQVEPLLELGTRSNTPFAAYPSVSVQMRGVVLKKVPDTNKKSANIGMIGAGQTMLDLKNPYTVLFDLANAQDIQAEHCYISSIGRSIQAGTVLIYEDITMECKYLTFRAQAPQKTSPSS